ncbi:dipeptide ABC transporter ATP-binding protein [Lutispora saccharofermentans]|uniref:ABC transporter ATP-binding protein n=1 Tax=Lutispora saccharofermentans TaxID=3024236 RepID=A0ABT1NDL0_9FIRM|nr:ABC transporter ATP-binding protein [Lutispora saccharofermentans]MCQ1529334.1 ABC transporter ATP-binding protein [Lutispora saccharofermentans]
MQTKIFEAKNIEIKFNLRGKVLTAVRNSSLDLYDGETLAIVGESGSGKSVFTKSFVGMLDKNGWISSGELLFEGKDLARYKTEKEWLTVRGKKIAMVFQDPMTSLNPLKTIGEQISEVITWHRGTTKEKAREEAVEILKMVGIQDAELRYKQYPHEFSGGMRQRVVIATAIACRPRILICDEPTTALDVTIQAQILKLIKDVQAEMGMSVIYITHDLGVVANVADRVAVMYAGQIVEYGLSHEIFKEARHPYTKALLLSLPQLGVKGKSLHYIKGTPPNLYKEIKGDAFAPRNPDAMKIDALLEPPFFKVSETHYAKTWLLHEKAVSHKRFETSESYASAALDGKKYPGSNRDKKEILVSLKDVSVKFKLNGKEFKAVSDVSFDIYRGETFSLVGESGSGKTTIGRAIMKIHPTSDGIIEYKGRRVDTKLSKVDIKHFRQKVQMIFQDPMASLNERAKVDYIVSEGLYNFKLFQSEEERKRKVEAAMEEVGLLKDFLTRFPHEFSGGQRQRLGIARALIMDPEFVIADEPISALDVSIRAQIINLLNNLKKERDLTYLFIAHDLSVVRFISDRIAVIYKGHILELADSEELFRNPLHPYTKSLLSAVPVPDPDVERNKSLIVYDPKMHDYKVDKPIWTEIKKGHFIWANSRESEGYLKELEKLNKQTGGLIWEEN